MTYRVTDIRLDGDMVGIILEDRNGENDDGFAVWLTAAEFEAMDEEALKTFLAKKIEERKKLLASIAKQEPVLNRNKLARVKALKFD